MKNTFLLVFLLFYGAVMSQAEEASLLKLKTKITLPGVSGRIDHMDFDAKKGRLFVCALGNNTLEVVDVQSGKVIKSIGGVSEPQGVAYVPEFDKIFVNNGGNGNCSVFDGESYQLLFVIPFQNDADNIRYDRKARILFIGYGGGGIAAVKAESGKVLYKIPLRGHPETFVLENEGSKLYVNVPRFERSVAVIDRVRQKITGKWIIENQNLYSNFPISLDEAHRRLFVGTFVPPTLKVLDTDSGRITSEMIIPSDCDDIFYDGDNSRLYLSCGEGFIEIIGRNGPDDYEMLEKIPTARGARTSLWVREAGLYFLAVPKSENVEASIWVFDTRTGVRE